MNDYGIKVSQEGIDVREASPRELAFTSKYRHIKLLETGKATSTSFSKAHGLGYRPTFAGYALQSGKYFLNYFSSPSGASLDFEYTGAYGDIYTTNTHLHAICSEADRLIYLTYLNPGASTTGGQYLDPEGDWGLKISDPDIDVFSAFDGEISLTSKHPSPLIVQSGSITVNIDEISADVGEIIQKTNYTDYSHGQSQANHLIMPDVFGAGSFVNFATEPSGLGPDYVIADMEVYIDASKIRVRVSRLAEGSVIGAYAPATSWTVKFFLTNIKLPS
jgi:hypothetical protein